MPGLSAHEQTILDLVRRGDGKWGWYQFEIRLSNIDVPRNPDLMTVLKRLADLGLVVRHLNPGSPNDRWELTEMGRSELKAGLSRER